MSQSAVEVITNPLDMVCRKAQFDANCDPRCLDRYFGNLALTYGTLLAHPDKPRAHIQTLLPSSRPDEFLGDMPASKIAETLRKTPVKDIETDVLELLGATTYRTVPYMRAAMIKSIGIPRSDNLFRAALDLCLPQRTESEMENDSTIVHAILNHAVNGKDSDTHDLESPHSLILKLALVCDDTKPVSTRFSPCVV